MVGKPARRTPAQSLDELRKRTNLTKRKEKDGQQGGKKCQDTAVKPSVIEFTPPRSLYKHIFVPGGGESTSVEGWFGPMFARKHRTVY